MERLIKEGRLPTYRADQVAFSRLGLGFEKLDRNVFDPNKAYDKVARIGVNDEFGHSGPAGALLKQFGLCWENVYETALKLCK